MHLSRGEGRPVETAAALEKDTVDAHASQLFHQRRQVKMTILVRRYEKNLTARFLKRGHFGVCLCLRIRR